MALSNISTEHNLNSTLQNYSSTPNLTDFVSGDEETTRPNGALYIGYFFTIVSMVTLTLHSLLLVVLWKCRRLPIRIKLLSYNLVVSDILFYAATSMLTWVLFSLHEKYYDVFYYARMIISSGFYNVSWSTVVGLVLDRLVILTQPYHFQKWLTRKNCILFIGAAWIIGFVLPVATFIVQVIRHCQWTFEECYMSHVLDANRITLAVLFITYTVFIGGAYVKIRMIMKSQIEKIHKATLSSNVSGNTHFRFTSAIGKVVLAYTILHMPIVVGYCIFLLIPELYNPRTQYVLQLVSYIAVILNSYITMYLYIWNFSECRMNFLLLYCSWNKKLQERTERLQIEVLDVVTNRK